MSEVKIQPVESVAYINPDSLDCSWPHHQAIYIDISSVGEGIIIEQPEPVDTISLPSRAKRLIKVGDTVISTVRPNRRSIFYAKNPEPNWVVSTGFAVIRPDTTKIDPLYLYYNVFSKSFTDQLTAVEKGAAYPAVLPSDVGAALISLHPLPEQRRIAHILGTLDDKIENNRKTAKTLEAMAQAIFQSWFVNFDPVRAKMAGESRESICKRLKLTPEILDLFPDRLVGSELGEIPEGWEVMSLGDLIELAYGKPLREEDRAGGNVPVYGSKGIIGWHHEKLINGRGIIVGRKGNPGTVIWVESDFYPIDTTFYVISKGLAGLHFLYYAMMFHELPSLGADSAVPGLNRHLVYISNQLIPNRNLSLLFENLISRMLSSSHDLVGQSMSIKRIRDTILPKLISGNIRVPEISLPLDQPAS